MSGYTVTLLDRNPARDAGDTTATDEMLGNAFATSDQRSDVPESMNATDATVPISAPELSSLTPRRSAALAKHPPSAKEHSVGSKPVHEQCADNFIEGGHSKDEITMVDLFCGAGGLSVGLRAAGYKTVFAADKLAAAVHSYNHNLMHGASLQFLTWDTELPNADLIVGGPPCQGFSSAGRRSPGDARNSFVAVFAHLVARSRPKAFLFENVEGFLTGDRGRWVQDLLDPLVRSGYCIHLRKINAAHYGVPQHRKRIVVIGGLGWDPGFPLLTHYAIGMPGTKYVGVGLPHCPTVAEALDDLPKAKPRMSRSHELLDHDFRMPKGADLDRIRALKPGQTMKDLPEHLWHETYRRRAYRRVMDGTPSARRGGPPAGLRRLVGDQPSKAITSGAVSEFVHPTEDRTLTLRECARLQTFPDNFQFVGTLSEKALLIGNAIPPRLGKVLGLHIRDALLSGSDNREQPGIKSFVVSHNSTVSPALRRTIVSIDKRYLDNGSSQLPLLQKSEKESTPMSLSQAQKSIIEKARNVGGGNVSTPLDDAALVYLLARLVHDLALHDQYPEIPAVISDFFETWPVTDIRLHGLEFDSLAEKIFTSTTDSDTYFSCLAALLKARLKFERILQCQPFPKMDQVGPRGLLQYGSLSASALAGLLFWRKWFYDTDNRAAQETGYLFEPILAAAIGGAPASAPKSPVRRKSDKTKGRQIDCIKGKNAYEFKLRVTIAPSGQGRWKEELAFPGDCVNSGYNPILVVLDPTENPKLSELKSSFINAGGNAYTGENAWKMLEKEAGSVMSQFLDRYVRLPLDSLLDNTPQHMPNLLVIYEHGNVTLRVGEESLVVNRSEDDDVAEEGGASPYDVDEPLPGV